MRQSLVGRRRMMRLVQSPALAQMRSCQSMRGWIEMGLLFVVQIEIVIVLVLRVVLERECPKCD